MSPTPEPPPVAAARTVYTDGACKGNPGPGGWAWLVPDGPFAAGPAAATTNQRMELQAVLEAVRTLPGSLLVVSDSTYVVNCFRDRWWEGWLARGWVNSRKEPVKNRDLWEPLIDEVRARPISFRWVKGHAGDRWNDLVDRLAVEAAETQQPRSGDQPPETVGAPDRPRGRSRGPGGSGPDGERMSGPRRVPTGREAPDGHLLVVLGHRPRELGGYGSSALADRVRRRLGEIIAAKAKVHPDLVVLSGLRLGAETLGAEAAAAAGVPWVAVLPYPDPDSPWPAAERARFAELLGSAKDVLTLQAKTPDSTQSARGALARRDAWLARNGREAIVVWDGEDDVLGRTVRSMQDAFGEEDVWILDPATVG